MLHVKIENIQHKKLRIIHQPSSCYRDLVEFNGSTSIHQRHLQFLWTEIYNSNVTSNPRFMWHFFRQRKGLFNLRKSAVFFLPSARSRTHGTNSTQFCGTLIRNQLPSSIKSSKSITKFKANLKHFENIDWRCVIYKE